MMADMLTLAAAADEATSFDLWRVAAMVIGSFVVAAVLVVCVAYVGVWRKHYAMHRAGLVTKWRGLLPRHVVGVSVSYAGLVIGSMLELAERLHDPVTPRPFVYSALYLIGLWSLWDVLGHTRYRLAKMQEQEPPPDEPPPADVNPTIGA